MLLRFVLFFFFSSIANNFAWVVMHQWHLKTLSCCWIVMKVLFFYLISRLICQTERRGMRGSSKLCQLYIFIFQSSFLWERDLSDNGGLSQPILMEWWRVQIQVLAYSFLENRHTVEEMKPIGVLWKASFWLHVKVTIRKD